MAELSNEHCWVALNLIPGLGSVRLKKLMEHFDSPRRILESSPGELMKVEGIGREYAGRIAGYKKIADAKKEFSLAAESGVKIITIDDEKYPERLKQIYDPPLVLYINGDILPEDESAVAIVGTRYPSFYGRMVAEELGRQLAVRGFTVVSGMARGIDSAAHKGAVSVKGRTIAVLGCGVDVAYPPENADLMKEIASCGAVMSEFPFKTKPDRGNFPRRNRIISGLSMGVVVVEAAKSSGSLITASFALEQGREVFAVPGKVDSPRSIGTHRLIKEGAKLVHDVEDILEELAPGARQNPPGRGAGTGARTVSLSPDEEKVYGLLSSEPVHVDDLSRESAMSASSVLSILMVLEVKGLVKQLPGKQFARKGKD